MMMAASPPCPAVSLSGVIKISMRGVIEPLPDAMEGHILSESIGGKPAIIYGQIVVEFNRGRASVR